MSFRALLYASYGLLVVVALGVAIRQPLLFQKLNTIRPAPEGIPDLRIADGRYLDIDPLIRSIPFQKADRLWDVRPADRYRHTILEGKGNCSQMVFGLGYQLDREGVDYQVIHLMTSAGLEIGDGHTVIRVPYRHDGAERVGVVDVSFGAILAGAGGPLDVAELEAAPVEGWASIPLNEQARFPYYHDEDDFVPEAVLGYIPAAEVRRYFDFLDRIYVPLGHGALEKYFYDGLALLLGVLPEVSVPLHEELLADRRADWIVHRGALGVLRSTLVCVPLLVVWEIRRRRR